jgi:hypothetical protein
MRHATNCLVLLALILMGAWLHESVAQLAAGAKLLLARDLIWGCVAAGCVLWLLRRRLATAVARFALAIERSRPDSLPRAERAGRLEGILVALFAAACAGLALLAMVAPRSFVQLLREDGPLENGTVLLYGLSAASCLAMIHAARGHRTLQLSLGVLAALFLLVGGEEISWGQRLLGFGTPEELATVNVQGEFTVHNIYSISLVTYPALAVTAMLLFVAPLLYGKSAAVRRIAQGLELPVAPPVCAKLYGLMILAYFAVGLRLGTPTPLPITYSGFAPHFDDEMMEFLISALFAVFALSGWRLRPAAHSGAEAAIAQDGGVAPFHL